MIHARNYKIHLNLLQLRQNTVVFFSGHGQDVQPHLSNIIYTQQPQSTLSKGLSQISILAISGYVTAVSNRYIALGLFRPCCTKCSNVQPAYKLDTISYLAQTCASTEQIFVDDDKLFWHIQHQRTAMNQCISSSNQKNALGFGASVLLQFGLPERSRPL